MAPYAYTPDGAQGVLTRIDRGVGNEGEITGRGTFWWDENLHRFQVLWCANDLPGGCAVMSDGATWEDNQLVLRNPWEWGGKRNVVKEDFSDITSSSFTRTIYQGEVPENLTGGYVFRAKKAVTGPLHWRY
jgi:hypothetical protein